MAISFNGEKPVFVDFNNPREDEVWRQNVLRGFAETKINVFLDSDLEHTIRIYLLDTGLALSKIEFR